jgi:high-affinity nickel-transport protein
MPNVAVVPPPLLLGFALGLRHALDADHLVAMSTIVSRERSLPRGALLGARWGVGHCLSLFTVGVAVVLLGIPFPETLGHALELGVGGMLVALGLASLVRGERSAAAPSASRRPFLVGVAHGLAGSGALAILVLATIRSPLEGLLYIALFGLGSVGGMVGMSAIMAFPFVVAARRAGRAPVWMGQAAALASVAFGVYYIAHQA